MKKHIKCVLLFIVCLSVSLSCFIGIDTFAATDPRLVDNADLLTSKEELTLTAMLDRISDSIQCDVVVVTVNDMGGKTAQNFADNYMDYNKYGYNGGEDCVLLAVGMAEREYHFSTRGFAIDAFTEDAIEDMQDCLEEYMTHSEYYDAFVEFAKLSEDYIGGARKGEYYKTPFSWLSNIIIAVIIGFIIALVYVSAMKAQLKSVRSKYTASGYEKKDSMKVTNHRDIYLYSTVTRTVRPQNNSSGGGVHSSSSGKSHGGGGGRF